MEWFPIGLVGHRYIHLFCHARHFTKLGSFLSSGKATRTTRASGIGCSEYAMRKELPVGVPLLIHAVLSGQDGEWHHQHVGSAGPRAWKGLELQPGRKAHGPRWFW